MKKRVGLWWRPDYTAWFAADTATAIGVAVRSLAISLVGYAVSGSTVAAGWLGSASMIAQQVFGIFGGTYVDRHDRRTLIIVNAVVSMLCWGSVAGLLLTGGLRYSVLLAIAVVSSAVNGFLGSATDAMLKSIIDMRDYPKAPQSQRRTRCDGEYGRKPGRGVSVWRQAMAAVSDYRMHVCGCRCHRRRYTRVPQA